jgi:polyisoprenoid-binding protein YceI
MTTATTATTDRTQLSAGTYEVDAIHSNANFEVEHSGISFFRGGFKPVGATLTVADDGELTLTGSVDVAAIGIDDENLRPHLLSPDFFDADRNPTVDFRSTEITGSADDLHVKGELSMAGFSLPVEAAGRLRGPIAGPDGSEKIAVALETTIDRTAFGMVWQMDLPDGNKALADDVKLTVELELGRS